jgi:transposase-like protein
MRLYLESLNLADAERLLCDQALTAAGSIVEAANLLGITRHALKRRIIKHKIDWPRSKKPVVQTVENTVQAVPTHTVVAAPAE